MHNLKFYQKNIIQYELINKFYYNNIKNLPELKKIILNFKNKSFKIKNFAVTLFIIELLTKKKCNFTRSKKSNILLKLQKGHPVGGIIILRKTIMYKFLSLLLSEILQKTISYTIFKMNTQNSFSIKLSNNNNINFLSLKDHYNLTQLLPYIFINFITNSKDCGEFFFVLKSFKFYIKILSTFNRS